MLNRRSDKLELLRIAEAVALEKSIDKELIIDSMESGIAKAAKSKFGSENEIKVLIDRDNGDIKLNSFLEVVENLSVILYVAYDKIWTFWEFRKFRGRRRFREIRGNSETFGGFL